MERRRELGQPTPLDYRPEVYPDLLWAFAAYGRLFARRSVGPSGDPLPIPTSEVVACAHVLGLTAEETADLDEYVFALDAAYFRWFRRERRLAEVNK